jgi:hypothetical protein
MSHLSLAAAANAHADTNRFLIPNLKYVAHIAAVTCFVATGGFSPLEILNTTEK